MEKTKKKIGEFCELLGVENYKERLEGKSRDFIFDLGVYILEPNKNKMSIEQLKFRIDFLLNHNNFEEATEAMKSLAFSNKETLVNALERIFGFESSRVNNQQYDDFSKQMFLAKEKPDTEKMHELMTVVNKLGKNDKLSEYYDKLEDHRVREKSWFDFIYVTATDMVKSGHYKKCDCTANKFDALVYSSCEAEAENKLKSIARHSDF